MRGVPVGNGKVALELGIVEVNNADVSGIAPDNEFLSYVFCVANINPATEDIGIVGDLIENDSIGLYGALGVRHKIQSQSGLVDVPFAFCLATLCRLIPLCRRAVKSGVRFLVVLTCDVRGKPRLKVRKCEGRVLV